MTLAAVAEPASEPELLARAHALYGRTLASIAGEHGVAVPGSQRRAKGWVGQLVERALGSVAGSRPEADFRALGIELKTLPVDRRGQPQESTFVATLDLGSLAGLRWEGAHLKEKLAAVLWVPVEAEDEVPLGDRRVGRAFLWRPSAAQWAVLRDDFEAIVELVDAGLGHKVTGHVGQALQLRPKGANAKSLRWSMDAEGEPVRTAPRAFYLRVGFTRALLREAGIVVAAES